MSDTTESTPTRRSSSRLRAQVRQLLKMSEAQAALGWSLIILLAVMVATIYLVQASRVAEVGRRIQILQFDLETLKRDNAQLERQIAEAQSLERLEAEARRLGFVLANPEEIEYVIVDEYPAEATADLTPDPTPEAEEPVENIYEAIWITLSSTFSNFTRGESVEQ